MAGAAGIRAGKAYYELGADSDPMMKVLKATEVKLRAWGNVVMGIGAGLSAFGGALSASLMEGIHHFVDAAAEIRSLSAVTGLGTQRVQELQFAAVQLGGSAEDMSTGLLRMSRALVEARDRGGPLAENLGRLAAATGDVGLNANNLSRMGLDRAFMRLGPAIMSVANPADADALAMQFFGKSVRDLIPLLRASPADWERFSAAAREAGVIMSDADLEAAKSLTRQWNVLKASLGALWNMIGAALAPSFERLLRILSEAIQWVTRFIDRNRGLIVLLDNIATACTVAGAGLIGLGASIRIIGANLAPLYKIASAIVGAVTQVIVGGAGLIYSGVSAAVSLGMSAVGATAGLVQSTVSAIFGAVSAAVMAGVSFTTSLATGAFGLLVTAVGFVPPAAAFAWSALTLLGGAVMAAAAAAAGGAGFFGILEALVAGLGITSGGSAASTGFFAGVLAALGGVASFVTAAWGVLSTAWVAGSAAAAAGAGATGILGAVVSALGLSGGGASGSMGVLATAIAAMTGSSALASAALAVLDFAVGMASAFITGGALAAYDFAVAAITAQLAAGGWIVALVGLGAAISLAVSAIVLLVGWTVVFAALAAAAFVAVLAVVAAAAVAIYVFWDEISAAAESAWNAIAEAASEAWEWIKEVAAAAWDWIVSVANMGLDAMAAVWNAIKNAATAAWDGIRSSFSAVVSYMGEQFRGLGGEMLAIWQTINNAITAGNWGDAMAVAWATIKLGFLQMVDEMRRLWDEFAGWIKEKIAVGWAGAVQLLSVGWAAMVRTMRELWIDTVAAMRRAALLLDPHAWLPGGVGDAWLFNQRARVDRAVAGERAGVAGDYDAAVAAAQAAYDRARAAAAAHPGAPGGGESDAVRRAREDLARARSEADRRYWAGEEYAAIERYMTGAAGPGTELGSGVSTTHGTFSAAALAGLNLQRTARDRTPEETRDAVIRAAASLAAIRLLLASGLPLPAG